MAEWRGIIRRLAVSRSIGQASVAAARRVGGRAKQIDPKAKIHVEPRTIEINGMPRAAAVAINMADSSARHEFDDTHGPALRPMGRAASEAR